MDILARALALFRPHPGFIAGRWYPCAEGAVAAGVAIGAAGSIRLLPFTISKPITLSDLGARITTASAGNNFQLAVYAHDPVAGKPTGNALCSTANISTTNTGTISLTVGTPVVLQPGTYWMAVNQDNTAVAFQTLSLAGARTSHLIGSATLSNISSAGAQASIGYSIAQTFGSWPDLTGQTFAEVNAATNALVWMKAA